MYSTPVHDAGETIVEWLGPTSDLHAKRELQERQRVLVAGLQHRTRNLMGVVCSTKDKTAGGQRRRVRFHARFTERLDERDRFTCDELVEG